MNWQRAPRSFGCATIRRKIAAFPPGLAILTKDRPDPSSFVPGGARSRESEVPLVLPRLGRPRPCQPLAIGRVVAHRRHPRGCPCSGRSQNRAVTQVLGSCRLPGYHAWFTGAARRRAGAFRDARPDTRAAGAPAAGRAATEADAGPHCLPPARCVSACHRSIGSLENLSVRSDWAGRPHEPAAAMAVARRGHRRPLLGRGHRQGPRARTGGLPPAARAGGWPATLRG